MIPKNSIKDWRIWWQILLHRWYIIAGCLLLAIGIGLYISLTTPPTFESESTIMIMDTELLSGPAFRFVPQTRNEEEIQMFRHIINSEQFLLELLDETNIKDDPLVQAKINRLCAEHLNIDPNEIAQQVYIEVMESRISFRIKSYNLIKLYAMGQTAGEAFKLCSLLTFKAIEQVKNSQLQSASQVNSFNQEILNVYKNKLNDAEERLRSFNSGAIQKSADEFRLTPAKYQEIESMILSSQIDIESKQQELESLSEKTKQYSDVYSISMANAVHDLKKKLIQRTENVCRLYNKFDWKDLEIVQMNEEIGKLKTSAYDKIQTVLKKKLPDISSRDMDALARAEKIEIDLELLKHAHETYTEILTAHNQYLKNEPTKGVRRERLEREINIYRQIYELLLQQARGTQINESAQLKAAQTRFQVIAPPKQPLERKAPHRRKIMLISVFLGSVLGVGLILGLEQLDLSIKYLSQVNEYLEVPVLATIPKLVSHDEFSRKKRLKHVMALLLPVLVFFVGFVAYSIFIK